MTQIILCLLECGQQRFFIVPNSFSFSNQPLRFRALLLAQALPLSNTLLQTSSRLSQLKFGLLRHLQLCSSFGSQLGFRLQLGALLLQLLLKLSYLTFCRSMGMLHLGQLPLLFSNLDLATLYCLQLGELFRQALFVGGFKCRNLQLQALIIF